MFIIKVGLILLKILLFLFRRTTVSLMRLSQFTRHDCLHYFRLVIVHIIGRGHVSIRVLVEHVNVWLFIVNMEFEKLLLDIFFLDFDLILLDSLNLCRRSSLLSWRLSWFLWFQVWQALLFLEICLVLLCLISNFDLDSWWFHNLLKVKARCDSRLLSHVVRSRLFLYWFLCSLVWVDFENPIL